MNPQIETIINDVLHDFSLKVIPTDDYIKKGNEALQKAFELLKEKSRFRVDRVYIVGSMGKNTSTLFSDFDCVVFVNDVKMPLNEVLDDFEDIITMAENYFIKFGKRTRFSVQFQVNGFEIDLLPAINLVPEMPYKDMNIMASEQALRVLQTLEKMPWKRYEYSSALCESNLKFIRQQSEFQHRLVRLAKIWNKSLFIQEYISGRATIIELIAIYAGKKEEMTKEQPSLLSGLQKFLSLISNFAEMKVNFPDFNPLSALKSSSEKNTKFGRQESYTPPFVIEPANPFNNMAKNIEPSAGSLFSAYAKETLRRLVVIVDQATLSGINVRERDKVEEDMIMSILFECQPKILPLSSDHKIWRSIKFVVGLEYNRKELLPSLKFNRNEDKFRGIGMKYLEGIKSYLTMVVTTAKSVDVVQAAVSNCIDVNIKGGNPCTWVTFTGKHTDLDATFTVPFPSSDDGRKVWVVVSLNAP